MRITLFNFEKRVNSTKQPPNDTGVNVEITLKNDIDFINPTFYLDVSYKDYNYLKWDNRFYYINNKSIVNLNTVALFCNIDYLRTYKTNIQNTTAFVIYSSSNYVSDIIDPRVVMDIKSTFEITSNTLITDGSTDGTYIINYVTSNATYGATGILWTNQTGCTLLSRKLTDTNFLNLENFEKQFNNVYQAIKSALYVPFNWLKRGGAGKQFILGNYRTAVGGFSPVSSITYESSILCNRHFNDFRDYCNIDYILYLPGYGFIEIDKNDYLGKSINVKLTVDGITGEGYYLIGNTQKYNTTFSTPVSIGTVTGNIMSVYSNAINTVANVVTGNVIGAVGSGVNRLLNTRQRQLGAVGSQGGSAGTFLSIDDWEKIYLVKIIHNSTISPDSLTDIKGRPCQSMQRIGDLTGYCQVDNASVQTDNYTATQYINSMLNGGVYIE